MSSREIYDAKVQEILPSFGTDINEVASIIPDFVCMKSTIQRARAKERPVLPTSASDLILDDRFTKSHDGERFLLFQTSGDPKIIAFATNWMLEKLCLCDDVFSDGTFRVSPLMFTQLYTIHGMVNGAICCLIFVLLPNKNSETNEIMFRNIKQCARERGLYFEPRKFVLDF